MDDLLRTIGLCRRAGRLEIGEEPVGAACRSHACRLLLLAADAADNTRRRAERFAEAGRCPLLTVPHGKEDLGAAVGRASCAVLGVTDVGLASTLAARLAAGDGAAASAAEELARRAERTARRKKTRGRREKDRGKSG